MSQRHFARRAACVGAAAAVTAGALLSAALNGALAQSHDLGTWAPFNSQVRGGWERPWDDAEQGRAQRYERDARPQRSAPNPPRQGYRRADPFGGFGGQFFGYGGYEERELERRWTEPLEPGHPTLSPDNIEATQAAIRRYSAIVADGGWPRVPEVEMRRGGRGQSVALLRQRLETTGDLVAQGGRYSGMYDVALEDAVRAFQRRHGLAPTGVADRTTIMALNVPPSTRLQQLRTNLVRLRSHAASAGKRYVVVNVPAAQVEAVENHRVVSRHLAVVGKIDRQTPVLRSQIHEINFNPFWHVPASIVRRDLVPKAREYARRGVDVLEVYRMEAFDGSGRKIDSQQINWLSDAVYGYSYRQMPWEENSMGFVKINFPNSHAVFLHDTPSQSLFSRDWRAESSGCVRVQNVEELVAWLMASTPGWDKGRVLEMKRTGERRDVTLNSRTPVHLVYVSAWATPDGTVHFRRDLYRQDGVGQAASAY